MSAASGRPYILKHECEDLLASRHGPDDASVFERASGSLERRDVDERTTLTGKTTPSAVDSEKEAEVTSLIDLRPSPAHTQHTQDVIVIPTAVADENQTPLKLPSVSPKKPPTEVATGLLGDWLDTLDSQPRPTDVTQSPSDAPARRGRAHKSILRTPSHLGKITC